MSYKIHYGEKIVEFDLPKNWEMLNYCQPNEKKGLSEQEIKSKTIKSLKAPISSAGLQTLLNKDSKVLIIIDDITRPTKTQKILEPLVDYLNNGIGIQDKNINIIIALGIHRDMTKKEYEKKVGLEIANRISWTNHNSSKTKNIGQSKYETPIELNKTYLEAEFVIAVGTIEPHPFAGFSGGAKALMPGLASVKTIIANHKLVVTKNAQVGKITQNKLRLDIEDIGEKAKLPFIINTILNSKKEIADIVAGNPYEAYLKGVNISRRMFETPISRKADVLITSANPLYVDIRQSGKCALNNQQAVKKGGYIIIYSACPEGMGTVDLGEDQPSKGLIKFLATILPKRALLWFIQKVKKYPIEDSVNLWLMFRLLARNELIFVSDNLSKQEREAAFIFTHFETIEQALKYVTEKEKEKKLFVNIAPLGGATYPIMR